MPFFVQTENGALRPNWSRLVETLLLLLGMLYLSDVKINSRMEQIEDNQQKIIQQLDRMQRDFYKPVYEGHRK